MDKTAPSDRKVSAGLLPTHFVSIFPAWLTRAEWDHEGFPNVSEAEQKYRLERRVSFFRSIDFRGEFTTLTTDREFSPSYSEEFILQGYLEGKEGNIYECFQGSAFIQPGYLTDDADSLWVFSTEVLVTLKDIAESLSLFIIQNSEQAVSGNADPAIR